MIVIAKNGVSDCAEVVFVAPQALSESTGTIAVKCPVDHIPDILLASLSRVSAIQIEFPDSHDGRGFSIARSLRQRGFTKKLRATGDLISDQFSFAIDCGFDEVEISAERLRRQPISHWRYEASADYRSKLRGPAGG